MRARVLVGVLLLLLFASAAETQRIRVNGVTVGGGGNPFDQDLNTTDNVTFANVTLTDDLIFGSGSTLLTPDVTGGTNAVDVFIAGGNAVDGNGADLNFTAGGASNSGGGNVLLTGGTGGGSSGGGGVSLIGGSHGDSGAAGASLTLGGGATSGSVGGFWQLLAGVPVGTDIAGETSVIFGTGSTGTGPGGIVAFHLSSPGSTGTDPNVQAEVFRVDHLGAMLSRVYTTAPAAGDCNDAAETGRLAFDSTNDFLYVCSGASGWRKITAAAP